MNPIASDRRRLLGGALALAALAGSRRAGAAAWPERPVKIIVPFGAGGGSDIIARALAAELTSVLGQSVVVDNRPGATGFIACEAVARAPKDGYTLLLATSATHTINPALHPKIPYDPVADFAPVAQVAIGGNVLVVHPSVPVKDLPEFIAHAKRQAAPLSYGSGGAGTFGHLSVESLRKLTGIALTHVPYKSAGAAVADAAAGHVPIAVADLQSSVAFIRSGKVRAIAVAGTERSPNLPDVPIFAEQGVAFRVTSWNGLFAPAGTPREVIGKLNAEVNRVLREPAMRERMVEFGVSAAQRSPEEFGEILKRDIAFYTELIRSSGIKPD